MLRFLCNFSVLVSSVAALFTRVQYVQIWQALREIINQIGEVKSAVVSIFSARLNVSVSIQTSVSTYPTIWCDLSLLCLPTPIMGVEQLDRL